VRNFSQASTTTILRLTCKCKPPNFFGYDERDLGSHSIRAGAAMALFLVDVAPHRIMILGRWSSDAFLTYLRPNVAQWTSDMSQLMSDVQDFRSNKDGRSNNIVHDATHVDIHNSNINRIDHQHHPSSPSDLSSSSHYSRANCIVVSSGIDRSAAHHRRPPSPNSSLSSSNRRRHSIDPLIRGDVRARASAVSIPIHGPATARRTRSNLHLY
jgi:hypothetical protein